MKPFDALARSGAGVVGVLGSFVRDTVVPAPGADPREEGWGGIAYALEGFQAALPEGWRIRPIVKVGEELAEEAMGYLDAMESVEADGGVIVVSGPNYRVTLRYLDREEREERLSPGPPPWEWGELAPRVTGCDALYVNFITGMEMDLATATLLRSHFSGPMYADLHSLFLAVEEDGRRTPRPLDHWEAWIRAFDTVQVNEREFGLLAGDWPRSKEGVQDLLGGATRLVAVTRGPGGATVFSRMEERHAPAVPGDPSGRPTGCGDVWGAVFFARLLAGDSVEEAMGAANRLASARLSHVGAEGLAAHLATDVPLRPAENDTP